MNMAVSAGLGHASPYFYMAFPRAGIKPGSEIRGDALPLPVAIAGRPRPSGSANLHRIARFLYGLLSCFGFRFGALSGFADTGRDLSVPAVLDRHGRNHTSRGRRGR